MSPDHAGITEGGEGYVVKHVERVVPMQAFDFVAGPFLPEDVVNSEPEGGFFHPMQTPAQIEIGEFRFGLSAVHFVYFTLDGRSMLGLSEDGDVVKARDLQRPLPADFRFGAFIRFAGKGGKQDAHAMRRSRFREGGLGARQGPVFRDKGNVAKKPIFSGGDAASIGFDAIVSEPFHDSRFAFRRVRERAGKAQVRKSFLPELGVAPALGHECGGKNFIGIRGFGDDAGADSQMMFAGGEARSIGRFQVQHFRHEGDFQEVANAAKFGLGIFCEVVVDDFAHVSFLTVQFLDALREGFRAEKHPPAHAALSEKPVQAGRFGGAPAAFERVAPDDEELRVGEKRSELGQARVIGGRFFAHDGGLAGARIFPVQRERGFGAGRQRSEAFGVQVVPRESFVVELQPLLPIALGKELECRGHSSSGSASYIKATSGCWFISAWTSDVPERHIPMMNRRRGTSSVLAAVGYCICGGQVPGRVARSQIQKGRQMGW